MNRIYRLVFNRALGQVQVASELAQAPVTGTSAPRAVAPRARVLALCVALLCAAPAFAATLPGGGTVIQGAASITPLDANTLTITQTTPRAQINWNNFSISGDGVVNFVQSAGSKSISLNVVTGATASVIDGALGANGQVFLINQNGILFGGGATVNVGGLVASSLPLASGNADSIVWNVGSAGSGSTALVSNQGTLSANGGSVSLIGAGVSNTGTITAKAVNLVAGGLNEITYDEANGLFNARVLGSASAATGLGAQLVNAGTLNATNVFLDAWGPAQATVINNAGVIQAQAIDGASGSLVVHATNGAVLSSGNITTVDMAVESHSGGSLTVAGIVDASGTTSVNTDGNISLDNGGNTFGGALTLDGQAIQLQGKTGLDLASVQATSLTASTTGALALGTLVVTGDATLVGNAGISEYGAVSISGATGLGSAGSITLDNSSNSFLGNVSISGGATRIGATGALNLGPVAASSLWAGADQIGLAGNVTTSSGQTYQGAVTLQGDRTLSGGAGPITFDGTIDGSHALALNSSGVTTFGAAVGNTSALTSLATDVAGTTRIAGNITAIGDINLADAVTLQGNASLTSFGGRVSVGDVSGGYDLALAGRTGNTLGGNTSVKTLGVTGGSLDLWGDITAIGDVDIAPAVTLRTDATVSAADTSFGGTVDGAKALTLRNTGYLQFAGDLGAGTALASLEIDANSLSALGITTTGDLGISVDGSLVQTAGAYRVGGNATLDSGGAINLSNIGNSFQGTVSLSGGAVSVTASSGLDLALVDAASLNASALGALRLGDVGVTGALTLDGNAISQYQALDVGGPASFTASNAITLQAVGNRFGGAVSLSGSAAELAASGLLTLDAVNVGSLTASADRLGLLRDITTPGAQTYSGALTLGRNTALTAGGSLGLSGSVDGNYSLTLSAGGASTINADIGQVTPLASLVVAGPAVLSGKVRSIGDQAFLGALELSGDTTLTSTSGDIDLGTVDGAHALAIDAAQGNASLGSAGSSRALSRLTIQADTARLGGSVISTTGAQRYDAAVTLGSDLTATSSGGADIGFLGSVDGSHALAVNTAGTTTFAGNVGGNMSLSSLVTDAAGSTHLGGAVNTLGYIGINDALVLDADSNLASTLGDIRLASTVSGASALSVRAGGSAIFGAAVDVGDLQVLGPAVTFLGGNVTVVNTAQFDGAVLLNTDVAMQGRTLRLGGNVDGPHALSLAATTQASVGGNLGATTPLASLSVTAPRFTAGSITTVGDLSLDIAQGLTQSGAYQVGGNARFDGNGDITLTQAGNRFDGRVTLSGAAIDIAASTGLQLEQVRAGSLRATAGAGLTLANATVAGNTSLAGSAIGLDAVAIGGALTAATSGAIAQTGMLQVAGTSQLSAGGDITLAAAGNRFGGALDLQGNVVKVSGEGDMRVARLVNGVDAAVDLRAGGALSVASAIDTGTAALTLAAGGGQLAIGNAVSGGQVSLAGRDGIDLAADVTAQGLALASQGGMIQQRGGSLQVSGATRIDGGAAAVNLGSGGNRFDGLIDVQGGATTLHGQALQLGTLSVASLDAQAGHGLVLGDGARIAGDAMLDAGSGALALGTLAVGGDLQASGTSIHQAGTATVAGKAGFDSTGAIALGTLDVDQLNATAGNGLSLADGARIAGDAMLDAGSGALALGTLAVGGDLQASGASIHQAGTATVAGKAGFDSAGAVALGTLDVDQLNATAGNGLSLADGARIAGDAVLDAGSGALALGTLAVGGDLQASGASIHQAGTATVAGKAGFDSTGAIALGTLDAGQLDAKAGNGLSLTDGARIAGTATLDAGAGQLDLGAIEVGGDLDASGAAIGQRAAIAVTGASRFKSAGDVTLAQAGNRFGGSVALQGGQAAIAATGDLSLGQVDVASLQANASGALRLADATVAGNAALGGHGVVLSDAGFGGRLQVASGAGLAQQGALRVAGDSSLVAAGAITLDNAGNDFQGTVDASGNGITLVDANDLRIGMIDTRGSGGIAPAALAVRPLGSDEGDVSLVAGGTLTLPAQAIDIGNATLTLQSNGGSLAVQQALSAGDIFLAGRDGISLGADVTAADSLDLRSSAGAITQGSGRLAAMLLTGQAAGAADLQGDNRIGALGDFSAGSLRLANGASLALTGNVQAGSAALLDVRSGDLRIDGTLAAEAVRLQSAGAIGQGAAGSIAAATLSGHSAGATQLGSADGFVANRVSRLGDFSAGGGFSLTNAGTLTLTSLNGSAFSVDAGDAAFFLKVDGGDLLQAGTTPVYAGAGHWWSSGRIGTSQAPVYVVTTHPTQVVDFVGLPPAYFYAIHPDGTPVNIGGAVNLPTTAVAARAQSGSLHRVAYIDVGALNAQYRAFGIVKPGIRLPLDQIPVCDAGDPDADCTQ